MTSISKNLYIDKLDDIVDEWNNIKMKPVDGKSGPCINFDVENNDKDSTFNVGDHIIKSKHNKATLRVGLKTFFWLKINENTVLWKYAVEEFTGEKTIGMFYEKNSKDQTESRIKKITKIKSDELYANWKGLNN